MTEFGGPEVLELVELPVPEPGPEEVLVKVARAGLNFADTHTRTNSYVRKAVLPLVPGGEVAGVREDTGERVVALVGDGGYAEYAIAPRELVYPIPDELDDGTALALIIQGLTAWHLYRTAGHVAAGESVVVHSAAGGVGSLAVQLGRAFGAGRVIATASSSEKRDAGTRARRRRGDRRRGRRAHRAPAAGQRLPARRRRLRHGRRGPCSTPPIRRSPRSGGSSSAGSPPRSPTSCVPARSCATRARSSASTCSTTLERPGMFTDALADLFARAARGELRTVIGATYPLAKAAQAHVDLRERRTTGKLLLDPAA